MFHTDEEGRRRSARKQGLSPRSSPTPPQVDLLIDNNQLLRSQSSPTNTTNNDQTMDIFHNHNDDLLSFGSDADNEDNDIGSSDNFLSSGSSSPHFQQWPNYQPNTNIASMANRINHHQSSSSTTDNTIAQLQQTIALLNNRLGMLESTNSTLNDTVLTPTPKQDPTTTMQHGGLETTITNHPSKEDPPESPSMHPTSIHTDSHDANTSISDIELVVTPTRHTAPDPPEDVIMPVHTHLPTTTTIPIASYAIVEPTKLPPSVTTVSGSPLQSILSPTPASSSFIPSPPPTPAQVLPLPTITPPQPVVYSKDTRLSFTIYKPTTDYSHWKALCLLEAHNNNTYANITIRQDRKYIINKNMNDKESAALYLATMKAMGTHAYNIISIDDTEEADGVALWTLLDEHFDEKEDSFLLKHDIKQTFYKLTRESNETIDNYRIKFEKQLHLMKINSIALPSKQDNNK